VAGELVAGLVGALGVVFAVFAKATPQSTMSMTTKAIESAAWLNLTIKYKAKGITCL
jgi:hypothetical protein